MNEKPPRKKETGSGHRGGVQFQVGSGVGVVRKELMENTRFQGRPEGVSHSGTRGRAFQTEQVRSS